MKLFKNTPEFYTTAFICMVWGMPLLSFIKAIFIRITGYSIISMAIIPLILCVGFLLSWPYFSRFINNSCVLFYLFCSIIYLLTYVFYPQNSEYLDEYAVPFLLSSLPFVFVGRAFNMGKLDKPLYIVSLLCLITTFINVLFLERIVRSREGFQYDMAASYTLLPHLLLVLWHMLRKFNAIDIIISLIGIYVLLGYGTRGPLLSVVCFICLYLVFFHFSKKRIWANLIIIGIGYLIMINFDNIIGYVGINLEHSNLSLRVLDAFEAGEISDDSGRGAIQNQILDCLAKSGVFGLGLCGDRVVANSYSHNIIIEFWASFGYFMGTVFMIAFVILIYKAWKLCSKDERGFLLVLIAYLIHLLVSSTFLRTPFFFLTIGYCSRLISERNTKSKDSSRHSLPAPALIDTI